MRIKILDEAQDDLIQGFRCLSKRFPFAIYYSVEENIVHVHAVLGVEEIHCGSGND